MKRRIIPGLDHGRPMPSWAGLSSPNLVAALPIKYICMGVARAFGGASFRARAFGGASFRAGGSTGTALSGHRTIYISGVGGKSRVPRYSGICMFLHDFRNTHFVIP